MVAAVAPLRYLAFDSDVCCVRLIAMCVVCL